MEESLWKAPFPDCRHALEVVLQALKHQQTLGLRHQRVAVVLKIVLVDRERLLAVGYYEPKLFAIFSLKKFFMGCSRGLSTSLRTGFDGILA